MIPKNLTLESLALPQDLYWNGKMEPTSPPSSELFPISESVESWLLEDNFANDILFVDHKNVDVKLNPSEIDEHFKHGEEIILELEFDVKEEPWPEVKSSSSQQQLIDFESFESVFHHPSLVTKVQNPYEGENCSKSIFNSATILTQLTPPQSPPQAALTPPQSPPQGPQDVKEVTEHQHHHQHQQQEHQQTAHHLIQAQPRIQPLVYQNIPNSISVPVPVSDLVNSQLPVAFTPNPYNNVNQDIAQNCQIVDEIVETRAKELPDWQDEENTEFNTSCFLSSLSPPSQSVDEDWGRSSPSSSDSSYSSVIGDSSSSDGCGGKMQTSSSLAKKRTRPYGRGPEDRKNRKKEQNKNAATRYRQKKKQEMETVLSEEQELSNRNKALSATLADRKREAKYLKKLIMEFYQSKKL
ncbi:uncharacterized protein LOC129952394 isoform X2 [Eupeodes corollae]|uniref:uncharacterized protein LOC129952394 isoform X2 n=1 Tax=Eupeodes corollae TaxID=290404 RepID=UPI002492D20C|nr:uncharacterized protein LOC129952394 isoform X2 [Eupeodes corollae]